MSLADYPWKSKAINLFAPHPEDVDRFCRFIREQLIPDGIDTIVLIVRYNYEFQSHPECRGLYPLSRGDVRKMAETCRECGIRLIPNMNLLGHQTVQDYTDPDGLLRAHPEFSETPLSEKPEYSYSLCPRHPDLAPLLFDLMDEIADAFQADFFHVGMDEVFYIGMCDRCKDEDPGVLFAEWINKLAAHLRKKNIRMMMWGDRLLNSADFGYGPWDASRNGTWTALPLIDKSIIITDWHYHNWSHFRSVEVFAEAGLQIYLCPFNVAENAKLFLDYAKEHDGGNILGVMETTWVPAKYFMDGMEGKELDDLNWYKGGMPHIVRCYNWLFRPEEFAKHPEPIPDED